MDAASRKLVSHKIKTTDEVLTAQFHGYPDDWREVFREAGYQGDYWWTIVE